MNGTHPNPQFKRSDYMSLDGAWEFEAFSSVVNFDKRFMTSKLKQIIQVPYCPESELSGICSKQQIKSCVYKRVFTICAERLAKRIAINFGAVDNEADIYINGQFAGAHKGGYSRFVIDISKYCNCGENQIVVFVRDDIKNNVSSGKQTPKKEPFGCFYERVTGIWQHVYIEFTEKNYIKMIKFYPDIHNTCVDVEVETEGEGKLDIEISYHGKYVGGYNGEVSYKTRVNCKLIAAHLWDIGKGNLYDVKLRFAKDEVESYFGLREVKYSGLKFLLNGKSVFQRLVLDQGYYPRGLYTAESEDDYVEDISMAMRLGFNGARLHQKVFDPIYLYHCDRLGFMVWGEYASWGVDYTNLDGIGNFINEWREALERDFNHPSIVLWCPLNETWEDLNNEKKVRDVKFVEVIYNFTKTFDNTRPCVDVSGGYHSAHTDLVDFHSYGNYEEIKKILDNLERCDVLEVEKLYAPNEDIQYNFQPISASEFGGMSFSSLANKVERSNCVESTLAWGYDSVADESAFVENYKNIARALLLCPKLSGFCYTQLYDIMQEQNGFFYYDRKQKLSDKSIEQIRECNTIVAAIER